MTVLNKSIDASIRSVSSQDPGLTLAQQFVLLKEKANP